MQRFCFRVGDPEDAEKEIPESVASLVTEDIQRMLSDVGDLMIKREFRTQSSLPDGFSGRFEMKPSEVFGDRGDASLLFDALYALCEELDRATLYFKSARAASGLAEAAGLKAVAKDVLLLADHLDGYVLTYGTEDRMRKFRPNGLEGLKKQAETDPSGPGASIGIVCAGGTSFTNGTDTVPISFVSRELAEKAEGISSVCPAVVYGNIVSDASGRLSRIEKASECHPFPMVNFRRIITAESDLPLLNPVEARLSCDREKGLWTMSNDCLGINVSKKSWDAAVAAFHGYFMFLWETYAGEGEVFEGEELDVRNFLLSLSYP